MNTNPLPKPGNKPSRLTEEEFLQIKKHVDFGYQLLENSPGEIMRLAAGIAQQHHERYDGKGYQHNLEGEQINQFARCVAVADVFDRLAARIDVLPMPWIWWTRCGASIISCCFWTF